MKYFVFFSIVFFGLTTAMAQEIREYDDEQLSKYAKVMVWADQRKIEMTTQYNNWIKEDEYLGVPRFLELKNAKGDSARFKDIGVTEAELVAFNTIATKYDSMAGSFMAVYEERIKNEIGAGLYNNLKEDLTYVEVIRNRYQKIYEELATSTD